MKKNMDLNTKIKKPEAKKKKGNSNNSKKVLLLVLLLILLAACFGGYMLLNKKVYNTPVNIYAHRDAENLIESYIRNLDNFKIEANYTDTDLVYTKLINGETDLIVVTELSGPALERAKQKGVEFEITPVANDGLVFHTDVENEVDDLSIEQIQKIYTGEYTNWNQVGSRDAKIIVYPVNLPSRSYNRMHRLVMKGLKFKEETEADRVNLETICQKDSIGWSYYSYASTATTMYGNDNIKFFRINGVEPNHDTIKYGTYPLTISYYIVTLKGNEKEEVKALKEAMLSKKGQKYAREVEGYVFFTK